MKKLLFTLLIAFVGTAAASAAPKLDANVAYKDKHVRFTVITDGLIRMEYSPDGKFIDDKSFVAINRKYPKIKAKVKKDKHTITITTEKMQLRYLKDSGKFTPDNLVIESQELGKDFTWRPACSRKENLKGTTRTLDRWNGDTIVSRKNELSKGQLEDGLLARDGWTLIDDSRNFLFDGDPEWDWVKVRDAWPEAQDWYFMAYGTDYKSALADFTTLAGKMSLPPRYVFGYWWSRYWAYSDHEFRQLLKNFEDYQIPVEVLVVDMDWHYTDPAHGGWTKLDLERMALPPAQTLPQLPSRQEPENNPQSPPRFGHQEIRGRLSPDCIGKRHRPLQRTGCTLGIVRQTADEECLQPHPRPHDRQRRELLVARLAAASLRHKD